MKPHPPFCSLLDRKCGTLMKRNNKSVRAAQRPGAKTTSTATTGAGGGHGGDRLSYLIKGCFEASEPLVGIKSLIPSPALIECPDTVRSDQVNESVLDLA